MSGLLWIGVAPGPSVTSDVDHLRFDLAEGAALALIVDPDEAATEAGIVGWATKQNAVLSAYAAVGDVVPLPLGAVFSSKDALVADAARQAGDLKAAAHALAGRVEYALHVRVKNAPAVLPNAAPTGRAYLMQRGRQRRGRKAIGQARTSALASLSAAMDRAASEMRTLSRKGPDRVLDLAALVPREDVPVLLNGVRAAAKIAEDHGLSCRLVGPSPAFSFAFAADRHD